MTWTNKLLQDILDAMPDAANLNQESTQQTIETLLGGVATEAKLEAVRALLQSIYDDCCPNTLLQDILDAMPSGGDYALETSMQTSLSRLQDILDRITSVEADLGYDALLDPLDTQKKSLDDVQGKLQDILDEMPDVAALMTEAKGEAIRTLLQSIYDDCCPNDILGDIAADAAAIEQDTAAIAADTDLMVFDIDRVRQECETIALQTGNTRVAAENIEAAIPDLQDSLEDLEICCTNQSLALDQVRANTDHLDQMETDLVAMRADIATMKTDVAAIKDCACRSPLRQMLEDCCRTEVEEDGERKSRSVRDAEEGVDFHEDDPTYDPPDGSADWATYKTGKCAWARYFVWQSGRDFEDLIQLYQNIGDAAFNVLSSTTVISAVAGGAARAAVAIAATRTAIMVAKGAAGGTGVGLIAVAVFEALVIAWKLVFDLFIDEVMDVWENIPKCELFRAIYCNTTGAAIKADWDAVIDTYVPAVPYLPLAVVFKLWMSQDTANALLAVGNAEEVPPVLTECACNCMSDWHDPDLALHTHDDLRSMTLSGNVITQWANTGAAGGYFAPEGSPTFDGDYVQMGQYKRMAWTSGSWGDGRFFSLYAVIELGTITNKWVMGQQGQDTYKPMIIHRPTVLEIALVGGDQKNITPPTGRFLVGMRREGGLTHFTLNGSDLGTLVGAGSPGAYPPFYLGAPTALQNGTDARIWAVVGWLRPTELTQAQEDDIIANLTALYGPFGV